MLTTLPALSQDGAKSGGLTFTKTIRESAGDTNDADVNKRTHEYVLTITNLNSFRVGLRVEDTLAGFGGGTWQGMTFCEARSWSDTLEGDACAKTSQNLTGDSIKISNLFLEAGSELTIILTGTESGSKETGRCNQAALYFHDRSNDALTTQDRVTETQVLSDDPKTATDGDTTCAEDPSPTTPPQCLITNDAADGAAVGSTVLFDITLSTQDGTALTGLSLNGSLAAGGVFDETVFNPALTSCSVITGANSACGTSADNLALGQFSHSGAALEGNGGSIRLRVPVKIEDDFAGSSYSLNALWSHSDFDRNACQGNTTVKIIEGDPGRTNVALQKESYASEGALQAGKKQQYYTPGTTMIYVLHISNEGPSDVNAGEWGDALPAGFTPGNFSHECSCGADTCFASLASYSVADGMKGTFKLPANCSIALKIEGTY